MPDGVEDRDADVWEALLAVADLAGDRWAEMARASAVTVVTAARRRPPSLGVLLLHDIQSVFDRALAEKLHTEQIITALIRIPDSPWNKIRKGEPIDPNYLASKLRKYDIAPKPLRMEGQVFKGYSRAQFEDAWKRYPVADEDDGDGE